MNDSTSIAAFSKANSAALSPTEQRQQLLGSQGQQQRPKNPTVEDKLRLVGFDGLSPAEKRELHRRQGIIR